MQIIFEMFSQHLDKDSLCGGGISIVGNGCDFTSVMEVMKKNQKETWYVLFNTESVCKKENWTLEMSDQYAFD